MYMLQYSSSCLMLWTKGTTCLASWCRMVAKHHYHFNHTKTVGIVHVLTSWPALLLLDQLASCGFLLSCHLCHALSWVHAFYVLILWQYWWHLYRHHTLPFPHPCMQHIATISNYVCFQLFQGCPRLWQVFLMPLKHSRKSLKWNNTT